MQELSKPQFRVYLGSCPLKVANVKTPQFEKQPTPNDVTEEGMVMFGKFEQPEKQ